MVNCCENCLYADEMEDIYYLHLQKLIPPRNLWVGPYDSVQHFLRWPVEYRIFLQLLCGVNSQSNILEVGCNHGRTALGLVDLLDGNGRYIGFDILKEHIEFASRNFEAVNSNFQFIYADIFNSIYNPNGKIDPSTYRFPANNESIDVIYAASVYTHLLPQTVEHYFEETSRVLNRNGKAMFSFFILDDYLGVGESAHELYEFEHGLPNQLGVASKYIDRPEAVIAYSIFKIKEMAIKYNLKVEKIIHGYWSKIHSDAMHEQDLVVLARIN
jgi:SAM-dependent methyltransferase